MLWSTIYMNFGVTKQYENLSSQRSLEWYSNCGKNQWPLYLGSDYKHYWYCTTTGPLKLKRNIYYIVYHLNRNWNGVPTVRQNINKNFISEIIAIFGPDVKVNSNQTRFSTTPVLDARLGTRYFEGFLFPFLVLSSSRSTNNKSNSKHNFHIWQPQ